MTYDALYSYSWLEPRVGLASILNSRDWRSYHSTHTIFQFIYFDLRILFTSFSLALIVNTCCNSRERA